MMKNIFNEWKLLQEQILNKIDVNGKNVLFGIDYDIFVKMDKELNLSMTIICDKNIDDIDIDMYGITVKSGIDRDIDITKKAILIKNQNSKNTDIFLAFSASLYEKASIEPEKDIVKIVLETLNEYKEYFKGTTNPLSEIEQQGLFGELSFIIENIDNNKDIINNWEGIVKNKHDFVFDKKSIEIKTTRNQTKLEIKISNENQLDNSYMNELNLVVYRLEKVNVGKTVYDLYKEIIEKISPEHINEFRAKIIKSGLNVNEVEDLIKFRLVEKYEYVVDDNFPKITKDDLKPGVHDVKYTIVLDGIESKYDKYENI